MKKLLTLALAFVALAVFTGLGVAQRKTEEKTGERYGKIDWDYQLMKVKVLEVNESAKTFTVHVAAELQPEKSKQKTWLPNNFKSLPKGGDIIDMWGDPSNLGTGYIYVGNNPIKHSDPSGARWVCFSHPPLLDFRCFDYQPLRTSGKVTQVNKENKTFTVEVTFSAAKLKALPEVGKIIDVTFNPTSPGGPLEVTTIKGAKSNSSDRLTAGQSGVTGLVPARTATGDVEWPRKVLQVNPKNNTFTVEVTFSAAKLKALPEVGKFYDITFTGPTTPGGPLEVTTIRGSKTNSSDRVATPPK